MSDCTKCGAEIMCDSSLCEDHEHEKTSVKQVGTVQLITPNGLNNMNGRYYESFQHSIDDVCNAAARSAKAAASDADDDAKIQAQYEPPIVALTRMQEAIHLFAMISLGSPVMPSGARSIIEEMRTETIFRDDDDKVSAGDCIDIVLEFYECLRSVISAASSRLSAASREVGDRLELDADDGPIEPWATRSGCDPWPEKFAQYPVGDE